MRARLGLMMMAAVLCMAVSALRADDKKVEGKSDFTSKEGREAEKDYKDNLWKAQEDYIERLIQNAEDYHKALSSAYVQALKNKDKDEAERLLSAKRPLLDDIKELKSKLKLLKDNGPLAGGALLKKELLAEAAKKAVVGVWKGNGKGTLSMGSDGYMRSSQGWKQKWWYLEGRRYKLDSGSELILSEDGRRLVFKSFGGATWLLKRVK